MKIEQNIIDILKQWSFEDNKYFLPNINLDRKIYLKCNDVLTSLGLIWNKWKKAHITDENIENLQETLNDILDIWEVETIKEYRDKYQFFETPYSIAKTMEELLEVEQCNTILEPSAWHGAIASIVDYGTCSLTCLELDPIKCDILKSKLKEKTEIINIDFLEYKNNSFDRIILNPPYSNNQAIKHILHWYELLNKWWVLVALTPSNILTKEYKDLTKKLIDLEPSTYQVEDWQFEFTNIKTIIIKLKKD